MYWFLGDEIYYKPWLWYPMVILMGAAWLVPVLALWLGTSKAFVEFSSRAAGEHSRRADEIAANKAALEAGILARVHPIVVQKLPELRRARASCLKKWGDLDVAVWEKEKADFLAVMIRPILARSEFEQIKAARLSSFIDEAMDAPIAGDPQAMSGADYEEFCAGLLRGAGWAVETTKASGDQGVDLIATKGPRRVALQCKRYTGSVPNAAVQEVAAGSVFYGANARAVVSTGNYTASARSLAEATRTLLLSHEHLATLDAALDLGRKQ